MAPSYQNNISQGSTSSKYARHVIVDNTTGQAIPVDLIEGTEISASNAPPTTFKVTTVLVNDTATKLPTSPAANRVGVEIFNLGTRYGGTGNSVWWKDDNTVSTTLAVGTTFGKELAQNESSNFQLTGTQDVWAICKTGETAYLQITEWIRTPAP